MAHKQSKSRKREPEYAGKVVELQRYLSNEEIAHVLHIRFPAQVDLLAAGQKNPSPQEDARINLLYACLLALLANGYEADEITGAMYSNTLTDEELQYGERRADMINNPTLADCLTSEQTRLYVTVIESRILDLHEGERLKRDRTEHGMQDMLRIFDAQPLEQLRLSLPEIRLEGMSGQAKRDEFKESAPVVHKPHKRRPGGLKKPVITDDTILYNDDEYPMPDPVEALAPESVQD